MDQSLKILPTIDFNYLVGKTFILHNPDDNYNHRSKVINQVEYIYGDTNKYMVKVGDNNEIMTYNLIIDEMNKDL